MRGARIKAVPIPESAPPGFLSATPRIAGEKGENGGTPAQQQQ